MRGARRDNRIAEPVAQLTFKWMYLNARDAASVPPTDIGDSLVWHNARHRDGNLSGLTPEQNQAAVATHTEDGRLTCSSASGAICTSAIAPGIHIQIEAKWFKQ